MDTKPITHTGTHKYSYVISKCINLHKERRERGSIDGFFSPIIHRSSLDSEQVIIHNMIKLKKAVTLCQSAHP